ncbi:uncharacterized protein LOC143244311 [Tachypleus tridentatus]|uniref:uncharacterized protein LOC143244311 n=1 Tax=Tachypleus tridentatus TaxID=6853 RepID=UPI003FD2BD4F
MAKCIGWQAYGPAGAMGYLLGRESQYLDRDVGSGRIQFLDKRNRGHLDRDIGSGRMQFLDKRIHGLLDRDIGSGRILFLDKWSLDPLANERFSNKELCGTWMKLVAWMQERMTAVNLPL